MKAYIPFEDIEKYNGTHFSDCCTISSYLSEHGEANFNLEDMNLIDTMWGDFSEEMFDAILLIVDYDSMMEFVRWLAEQEIERWTENQLV